MIHISEVAAIAELASMIEGRAKAAAVVGAEDVQAFVVFQHEDLGSTQLYLDPDDEDDRSLIELLLARFNCRATEAHAKDRAEAERLGVSLDTGPRAN